MPEPTTPPDPRALDATMVPTPEGHPVADPLAGRRRLLSTSAGSHQDAFEPVDWAILSFTALVWGSSFLFIDIGLDSFTPPVVALARLLLGAATLALFARARRSVDRADLGRIAVLGVVWMGIPMLLFPLAQQHVDSSVAGMINGATPLFTTLVAVVLLRRLPGRWQVVGLAVGFLGVVAIGLPNVRGADASPFGVGLLLLAVLLYGFAFNLAVPLQQRHGALPVLLRAQLVAVVVVAPFALVGLPESEWSWPGAGAMVALGVLGTGLAFPAMTTLVGRVGGPRGSIATYLVPVVAIVLGVVVRSEQVATLALGGVALVIAGAWLTSRRQITGLPTPPPRDAR